MDTLLDILGACLVFGAIALAWSFLAMRLVPPLACPKCGSTDLEVPVISMPPIYWATRCFKCSFKGPPGWLPTDAIRKWNKLPRTPNGA